MWFRFLRRTRRCSSVRPSHFRPQIDALEDRCLLSAGALDTTFGGGAGYVTTSTSPSKNNDTATAVLIQPWDGKIVAAGEANGVMSLVRYNTDGSLDTTFGRGGVAGSKGAGSGGPAALYPSSDTTGNAKKLVEASGGSLVRFNVNGSVDTSFGTRGVATVSLDGSILGLVIQSDGKLVVGGGNQLARLNANGTLDATFGSGGIATLSSLGSGGSVGLTGLGLQPDGKLVVGGETPSNVWQLARFNSSGTLDTTFDSAGSVPGTVSFSFAAGLGGPSGLAIYPGTGPDTADAGKIEIAGSLQGNSYEPALARYNADGTPDTTFGQSGQVVTPFPTSSIGVTATALQADGKIIVVGLSQAEFGVLRYNTDGSLDTTFSNSAGRQVLPNGGLVQTFVNGTGENRPRAVAIQPDGRIVVAGLVQVAAGSGDFNFMVARYLPGPEIGTFTASAATVTAGSSLTLTASNISDGDPSGTGYATITQVAFYGVDSSGNQYLLGTQSNGVWTLNYTVSLASGSYTLFAQATDSGGIVGDSASLSLAVQ
jgi:uncharacterized delta-60 repeat protein